MVTRYRGDPYWTTAKVEAQCSKIGCGQKIARGDDVYRFKSGAMYAKPCGHGDEAERRFVSEAQDEEFANMR